MISGILTDGRAERVPAAGHPPPTVAAQLQALVAVPVFMIVDAARAPSVLPELARLENSVPVECLWQGRSAATLPDVAPYLFPLDHSAPVAEFVAAAWGCSWGIFAATTLPMPMLRRHFRRFTMVRLEENADAVYFRFYDPRVLRSFLPTCNRRQVEEFFAGITCLMGEGTTGHEVLMYAADADSRLNTRHIEVDAGSRPAGRDRTITGERLWP